MLRFLHGGAISRAERKITLYSGRRRRRRRSFSTDAIGVFRSPLYRVLRLFRGRDRHKYLYEGDILYMTVPTKPARPPFFFLMIRLIRILICCNF